MHGALGNRGDGAATIRPEIVQDQRVALDRSVLPLIWATERK